MKFLAVLRKGKLKEIKFNVLQLFMRISCTKKSLILIKSTKKSPKINYSEVVIQYIELKTSIKVIDNLKNIIFNPVNKKIHNVLSASNLNVL